MVIFSTWIYECDLAMEGIETHRIGFLEDLDNFSDVFLA